MSPSSDPHPVHPRPSTGPLPLTPSNSFSRHPITPLPGCQVWKIQNLASKRLRFRNTRRQYNLPQAGRRRTPPRSSPTHSHSHIWPSSTLDTSRPNSYQDCLLRACMVPMPRPFFSWRPCRSSRKRNPTTALSRWSNGAKFNSRSTRRYISLLRTSSFAHTYTGAPSVFQSNSVYPPWYKIIQTVQLLSTQRIAISCLSLIAGQSRPNLAGSAV